MIVIPSFSVAILQVFVTPSPVLPCAFLMAHAGGRFLSSLLSPDNAIDPSVVRVLDGTDIDEDVDSAKVAMTKACRATAEAEKACKHANYVLRDALQTFGLAPFLDSVFSLEEGR